MLYSSGVDSIHLKPAVAVVSIGLQIVNQGRRRIFKTKSGVGHIICFRRSLLSASQAQPVCEFALNLSLLPT